MDFKIQRVASMPLGFEASTMYIVASAVEGEVDLYFSGNEGEIIESRRTLNRADVEAMLASYAGGAEKLITPRLIEGFGDATFSVSFDGSENVAGSIVLSDTTIVAGEYPVATYDSAGRATAGRALVAADIPALPGSKITSDLTVNTSGNAATATTALSADAATKLATPRSINGTAFDGTQDIVINAVDATARIAAAEKGVADGVATLDATGKVPSSQLPSFVDDVIEAADFASLPVTGESSKIYVAIDTGAIYRWSGTAYILIPPGVGTSDTALKLMTARSITATGDVDWTVNFDGSANATAAATLSATGIVAGEYAVPTFDAKGRATSGRALVEADIPALTSTTVVSAGSITLTVAEW